METKCNHTAFTSKFCPNCGIPITINVLNMMVTTAGFVYQRQVEKKHPDMRIINDCKDRHIPIDRTRTVSGVFVSTAYLKYGIANIHYPKNSLLRDILAKTIEMEITDPVWCSLPSKGFEFTNIGDLVTPVQTPLTAVADALRRINFPIIYDDGKIYDPVEFATYVNSFNLKTEKYKVKPWIPIYYTVVGCVKVHIVQAGWDAVKRIAQYEKDLKVQKAMLR